MAVQMTDRETRQLGLFDLASIIHLDVAIDAMSGV